MVVLYFVGSVPTRLTGADSSANESDGIRCVDWGRSWGETYGCMPGLVWGEGGSAALTEKDM